MEVIYNNPMTKREVTTTLPHTMPSDLQKALTSSAAANKVWETTTPLARNEWICWVTSGKKAETRAIRIEKAISKLKGGVRRPCCWAGCTHR